MKFNTKVVKEDLSKVELFAEGKKDNTSNACPKAHCRIDQIK